MEYEENIIEYETEFLEDSGESMSENYEIINEANDSYSNELTSDLLYIQVEDDQYNETFNLINTILHCNYILCAISFCILIYLFLHYLGERRKI